MNKWIIRGEFEQKWISFLTVNVRQYSLSYARFLRNSILVIHR